MKKMLAVVFVSILLLGCASNSQITLKNGSNHTTSNGITTSDNGNSMTLNSTNSSKPVSGSENGSQVVDVGGSIGIHKS